MRQRFERAFFVGAWLLGGLVCFKALLGRLYNPDLWWHLAVGRHIVQTGTFLRADIFSHTLQGTPWINFEWLSQVAFYGVYAIGGLWGLFIIKTLLCAAVVALLWAATRRAGAQGPLLFLLSWVAFKVTQPRLQDRPELLSLFFLGLLVWYFLRLKKSGEKAARRSPVWVFIGMVMWVNSHGGFVYGLGLIFLFYVGALWAKEAAWVKRILLKNLAAGAAAVLFNPYGFKIAIVFWEHYQQLKNADPLIQEWRAAEVLQLPYFWGLYAAVAATVAAGLLKGRKEARFWTPAVVMFAIWGAFFYRNTALLAFVGVPFLAAAWRVHRNAWLLWLVALVPVATAAPTLIRPLPKDPVLWSQFPAGACGYVRANDVRGTMFNTYDIGGYIEWELGPERLVFMDGRYLFYPLLQDYDRRVREYGYLENAGIDYGIVHYAEERVAFLREDAPFPLSRLNLLFPRDRWALVFWDDAGLVFVRRTPAFKELIRRDEYAAVWPHNLAQMRFLLENRHVKQAAAEKELERHRRENGPTIRGQFIENLLKETANRPN